MNWYKNLRISAKLISGFVLVAAIAAAVGWIGIAQIHTIDKADAVLYEHMTVPIGTAGEIAVAFQRLRINLRDMVAAEVPEDVENFRSRVIDLRGKIDTLSAAFEKTILSDEARRLYQEFIATNKAYAVVLDRIIELKLKDKHYEIKQLINGDANTTSRAEMDALMALLSFKAKYATEHPDPAQIAALGEIAQMTNAFQRVRVNVRELLIATNRADLERVAERIQGYRHEIDELSARYAVSVVSSEEQQLWAHFLDTRKVYGPMTDRMIALASLSDPAAIHAMVNGDGFKAAQIEQAAIDALVEKKIRDARNTAESNTTIASQATQMMITIILIGVAIAVLLGIFISRMISNALARGVEVAQQIAEGDLDVHLVVDRRDETGQLMAAMQQMHAKLSEVVGQVRNSSDAIAAGASEIAQGNADLSQRTEEQASSLEETASSMEQLTSTVKQNADNAQQANQLAAQARREAEQGGTVAQQAVGAMGEISASSKKIADIISVIDEIAFQTNLLALNAAVEAARAGEQGRGFAVVAGEVRNLAQRSADSAKQIKELITASVSKVEEGSKYVDATGKALDEIVGAVKKVTDVMAEIAAASHEQSSGIEQVNRAVMQMDEVTQQNAALVEEAAAAAKSMEDQGTQLKQLMSFFKLSEGGGVAPAAVASSHSVQTVATKPATRPAVKRTTAKRSAASSATPAKPASKPTRVEHSDEEWEEF